jgi:hypothetical protein
MFAANVFAMQTGRFLTGDRPIGFRVAYVLGGLFLSEDLPLDRSEMCSLIVIHEGA